MCVFALNTPMTLTLELDAEREAPEMREILGDLGELLRLRMNRKSTTDDGKVASAKLIRAFNDLSAGLVDKPEGAAAMAAVGQ